jgi:hypothetical protein
MGRLGAPNGDYYYASQPPLGYILPYVVLVSFGLHPDVLPLQIFNMATHLICIFLVFLIIRFLAGKRQVTHPEIPALAGAAVYTFMPITLWFHSNVYSFEVLVQVFFLFGIYLFLRVMENPVRSGWLYFLIGINAFCMSYTEWVGVLFAFAIGVYALVNFQDKSARKIFLAVAIGTAAAVCLTFIQYSRIAGTAAFLKTITNVYLLRSGISSAHSPAGTCLTSSKAWLRIGGHFVNSFGPFLLVTGVGIIITIFLKYAGKVRLQKTERAVILISLLPAILHNLLFFNLLVAHDYLLLKDAIFFSIVTGILWYVIRPNTPALLSMSLALAFIFSLVVGIDQFWKFNKNSSDCFKKSGEFIAKTAKPDEVIFADMPEYGPQLVFYSHRNVEEFWGEQPARAIIHDDGARRGIIFQLDGGNRCTGYHYLE